MAAAREQDKIPWQSGTVLDWDAWDGTMPPPEVLRQYEELLPGSAIRIMTALENELVRRRDRAAMETEIEFERLSLAAEDRSADYEAKKDLFTIIAAGIIVLTSTAGAIYLIATGHGWGGLGIAVFGSGISTGFLVGRFGPGRFGRRRQGHQEGGSVW